ncbi:MAG: hypothetical protein ACYC99_15360, partial [Candidatus Geothermincolia bacterium]
GAGFVWEEMCKAAKWTAGVADRAWDKLAYPVLRKIGHGIAVGAKWCWNNRYVKALVAGVAAAAVLIIIIIVVVITLPVSLTVGLVAAIATAVATIGFAIYYAATHPDGFTFLSCFFKSLSAGTAVAVTVLSMGSLGAAFSAGWSEIGLLGALKCAAGNGLMSMLFEGSTSYLFTSHISIKRMAVAFVVGAISAPVAKIVKDGVVGSRLVQALVMTVSDGQATLGTRTAVFFLQKSGTALHGMLTILKDGATAFGGKAVYVVFSGAFGMSMNLASSMVNHKPITFSGMLASFLTGMAVAGIGLTFGGKGLDGLLSKIGFLKEGFGRLARKLATKLITKTIDKTLRNGLKSGFKRLFKENEPVYSKEE